MSCEASHVDIVTGLLLFLGGVLSKPASELASFVATELIRRRQVRHDTGLTQADRASERCLEAMAVLADEVPRHRFRTRAAAEYPDQMETYRRIAAAEAQLEANLELLDTLTRERMRQVLLVLRDASQLGSESGAPFAHYDSTEAITREAVRSGRVLLSAHLRRESLPEISDKMAEYLIAEAEADEVYAEVYEDEATDEYVRARDEWRRTHGVT